MIQIRNASQIVTPTLKGPFEVLENSAIVGDGEKIHFIGPSTDASSRYPAAEIIDATGKTVVPGFVDSHTHLIFGGDRSHEFMMRLRGATYREIAATGGGIQHTVQQTRQSSEETLLQNAISNVQKMIEHGTTTVEIKSGYGLNWTTERKILNVAKSIPEHAPVDVVLTFLGAHDFPRDRTREQYLEELLNEMIPAVAEENLAEFCDVFCDEGYYSVQEAETISRKAKDFGLRIKLHVDELADVNGAFLAGEIGALSADHLIRANEHGIRRMAEAGVIPVLLPGTSFALKAKGHAPARRMIEAGARVALATDFNPGTCYSHSLQYVLQLAVLLYGLTPEEGLTAITLHGAAAINRHRTVGSLEVDKQLDCLIFDIPHYGHLFYNLGVNRLETVIKKGKVIWNRNKN